MTIAQKLALKRFLLTLVGAVIAAATPVIVEVLKDPTALQSMGIPATVAAVIVAVVAAYLKLQKEKGKGLDIPGDVLK